MFTLEGGDGIKDPTLFETNIPITFTYDDGTTETVAYPKSEPVTLTYDDGTTETITVAELAKAFDDAEVSA